MAYSGCFYTPIDLEMPIARMRKILENLQPELVITKKTLKNQFAETGFAGQYLFYEDIAEREKDAECVSKIPKDAENLLYVLYTSGSTGVPKGVEITHRSVINYIDWVTETFQITKNDSFGNQAPFFFDNSILDIYSTLKTGAVLHIIPKNLFSQPVPLLKYLKEKNITTIFWVPSALTVVAKLNALKNVDLSCTLKRVLFCGEVMPNKQLNYWRRYLPEVQYANLYGPTEITDACICYIVDRPFDDAEPLPIGNAISNVEILLLEGDKEVQKGEICVKGACLSRGYYRNPKKTAEVFVPNPTNPDEIIYRTGDLGQYNEKGELLYLGRKDCQIKHRGHRIELGEIETAASSQKGVASCCCLYDEKQQKIVLFLEGDAKEKHVEDGMKTLLPHYMMPNKIIILKKMPINSNGKTNRMKLKRYLT
ncbi:MAG TPA: amino acid adenylation domain-containing protein [Methanocorpusculum sp.]|nr:amino acid adenylation domain-containing protein [Methanocorpusculum sp.]